MREAFERGTDAVYAVVLCGVTAQGLKDAKRARTARTSISGQFGRVHERKPTVPVDRYFAGGANLAVDDC
jgi:hypothetical protein